MNDDFHAQFLEMPLFPEDVEDAECPPNYEKIWSSKTFKANMSLKTLEISWEAPHWSTIASEEGGTKQHLAAPSLQPELRGRSCACLQIHGWSKKGLWPGRPPHGRGSLKSERSSPWKDNPQQKFEDRCFHISPLSDSNFHRELARSHVNHVDTPFVEKPFWPLLS